MENVKTTVVKAIREGKLFDLVAEDGWQLTKAELLTIAKELAYALENALDDLPEEQAQHHVDALIGELEDCLYDDED